MRQSLAFAIVSSTLAGCSLLYSPNNLPNGAPNDAEIILDADPRMLVIDEVEPEAIYEGQGDSGSQPALVVLHGHHIIENNTIVEITPQAGSAQLTLGAPVIAKNGNWIAIPVTAHVDQALKQGASVALDVKVTESIPPELGGGTATSPMTVTLTLLGLDELTNTSPEIEPAAVPVIHTAKLAPLYARVDLSMIPTAKFADGSRALIRSVSSITANALVANGATAGTSAAPGAVGGCDGGAPASTVGCGNAGGKAGTSATGLVAAGAGGGGGFASDGTSGTGTAAGAGGASTGDELIVTYDGVNGHPRNQAGGGGGGGNPLAAGTGGGGGAGGGSIELTAGGDVSVGAISAKGGDGGAGTSGGGGGGGGAGGIVMLRAGGALASGTISVLGGKGNGNGGAGSGGRVRWDVPDGAPPTVETGTGPGSTLHRGPAFTLTTRIFRTASATISLIGAPNDRFNVRLVHAGVTSGGPQGVSFSPDGTATFVQTLQQGLTQLCITLDGGLQGAPEADKCVDVAYLP